jgi:hypothetical protein
MNEDQVYALEINGQFFSEDEPLWAHGTAGEVLEQIADELGIADPSEEEGAVELPPGADFPSAKALLALQTLEDKMGKTGTYKDPDSLLTGMIKDGFARRLTEEEYESWIEDEEMEEYDEARGELGEEWTDGVWET